MSALNIVSCNTRALRLRTIKFNDADVAVAAVSATITLEPIQIGMGTNLLVHETLVHERTTFAGNAGTLLLDIGKSGSTEIYAKDVGLKGSTGANTLGSGTTSVKPRIIEANGLPVVLTLTSSSGNLSTLSAGEADIFLIVSNLPALN